MKRLLGLSALALVITASVQAADVQLVATYDMPGRVPVSLCAIDGSMKIFDPMAAVMAEVNGDRVSPVPAGTAWSKVVSSADGALVALARGGQVERWSPSTGALETWGITGAIDMAYGCEAIWLLYHDGRVERRQQASGAILGSWVAGRSDAAKIQVSETLEQVVLAPIQGSEVYLHDTGGVHLRTVSGPAAARCAEAALGPGGVLAVADRFNGTIELYGPLGDHVATIAPRGQGAGDALRPASLTWRGAELWALDPALGRVSVYKVEALDDWVMPLPLVVSPAGGSRTPPNAVEFVLVSRALNVRPDFVQVELQLDDGTEVSRADLPVGEASDTLRWTPDPELEPGAAYRWRVRSVAIEFNSGWSAWMAFSTVGLPERFELLPNYPNPFNASTVVAMAIPDAGDRHVAVEIYNTLGQKVRTVFDGIPEPGTVSVIWDGRDDRGVTVGSGVYLIRLLHREGTLTRKAVMIK